MGLDDLTSDHLGSADAAIVRALGGGEALLGPAERRTISEERVFLLDTEHGLLVGVLRSCRYAGGSGVGWMRRAVREFDLAQDEDVVSTPDGVGAGEHRTQNAIRIVARALDWCSSRRTPRSRAPCRIRRFAFYIA